MNKPLQAAKANYYFYLFCGISGFISIAFGLLEMGITIIPETGSTPGASAVEWFSMYKDNVLLAMRNMGLINIVMIIFMIPAVFAVFICHKKNPLAGLALVLSISGSIIYIAGTTAFPMLSLSKQYFSASTEAQRQIIAGAGEAMLAIGKTHSPGTFIGFIISDIAAIFLGIIILQGGIFKKVVAYVGIIGSLFMVMFEISASFIPSLWSFSMIFASLGGILLLVWYLMISIGLIKKD